LLDFIEIILARIEPKAQSSFYFSENQDGIHHRCDSSFVGFAGCVESGRF
jgi:hypothetical protein